MVKQPVVNRWPLVRPYSELEREAGPVRTARDRAAAVARWFASRPAGGGAPTPSRLRALLLAFVLVGCASPAALQAEPRLALVRSVRLAVQAGPEAPSLVMIARGPSPFPGAPPVEVREQVDPTRCSIAEKPYRQVWQDGRWFRWFHVLWHDPAGDRILGSVLAARDEMPGPGVESTWQVFSIPRAVYGYDSGSQSFSFEPDLATAPFAPRFAALSEMRRKVVLVAGIVPREERAALEREIERQGGLVAADSACRVELVVIPPAIDFVDVRDEEIELLVARGARVLYADWLLQQFRADGQPTAGQALD